MGEFKRSNINSRIKLRLNNGLHFCRIGYTPVRSRLTSLMDSHIVRLTDRKYMMRLTSKLQEDYETRQKVRIERRKLKPTSILPELSVLKSLSSKPPRRHRYCAPMLNAEAAKKCKQLPQLLFADDSQSRRVL